MTAPSSHPTIGGLGASTNYLALYIYLFLKGGDHMTLENIEPYNQVCLIKKSLNCCIVCVPLGMEIGNMAQ